MRMHAAAGLAGFLAATAFLLAAGGPTARAGEDKKDEALAIDLRKKIKKVVRLEDVAETMREAPTATLEQLKEDQAWAASAEKRILQKIRQIDRSEVVVRAIGGRGSVLRGAHFMFHALSIENERLDRLKEIDEREREAVRAKHPGWEFRDGFFPAGWYGSPQADGFQEERRDVRRWFDRTLADERRRAREGETEAGVTLAELRKEANEEYAAIAKLQRALRKELHGRGEPDPEFDEEWRKLVDRAREREAKETHETHRLRLAPLRTEYEAKTGESVEVWFQVWNGAPPYRAVLRDPKSEQRGVEAAIESSGDHALRISYAKPGTYAPVIDVTDDQGEWREAAVSVRVTGTPVPPEKAVVDPPAGGSGGGGGAGGGVPPTASAVPVPIAGTFRARMWHAHAALPREDEATDLGSISLHATPIPLTVTIDPAGVIRGSARFDLEKAGQMKPSRMPDAVNRYWRVSFDLEGKVDWATGATVIEVRNGSDEKGWERDVPKTDDQGRPAGFIGHWRIRSVAEYSATLTGWSLPGPGAAAWLAGLAALPQVVESLKSYDLSQLGLPGVTVEPGGGLSLRGRGFFGASPLGSKPGPDAIVPVRRVWKKALEHSGYDGLNEKDEDDTARRRTRDDKAAQEKSGAWYLEILDAAAEGEEAAGPPADPANDLLAFGLWPTRPIHVRVGGVARARAMGVFADNVHDPVDLSAKATWASSAGLAPAGGGAFTARQPGTHTITATFAAPSGPMSSTITVIVTP